MSADFAIFGNVVTMVGPSDVAEGVAVRDGRIVAVGSRDVIMSHVGQDTSVLELHDSTVLPGFVDSHIHPVFGLGLARGADLNGCDSLDDVRQRLFAELDTLRADEWLLGWGLDPNVFGDGSVDNSVLDEVAGERPVFIRFFDAHAALASTAAMRIAQCDGTETFDDGSRVVTDAEGRPTGYLLEVNAFTLVEQHVPEQTFDERVERLYALLRQMAEAGFTAGQVQDLAPETEDLLRAIEAARELPIRLRMSPWFYPGTAVEEVERLQALQGVGGRRWIVQGVKLMIDGTIDNGTAWLHEPDCHGESTASLWLAPEGYREAMVELDRRAIPTTTHAIGDAGIDYVVDVIASLPRGSATHRIEHIETMTDETLAAFIASGATASMQPTHCTLYTKADGTDNWSRRLGAERTARGFRMHDLVAGGVPLALGSDWPVAPSDAVGILADAQLRRSHDRPDVVPIQPDQALSADEALRGFTVEPHRTIGQEGGMIVVGAPADLTVLDQDPRTADPTTLGDARVVMTLVAGQVVVQPER